MLQAKTYHQPTSTSAKRNSLFFQPHAHATPHVQRKCSECEGEEKKLQRKDADVAHTSPQHVESYVDNLGSSGQGLSNEVKHFFEPRLGYDLSQVKLHTDSTAASSADSIRALAYTSGNHIVFNKNQYSPETDNGKKLLGHELVHVIQQKKDGLSRKIQRQPDFLKDLDPSCTVDWQAVWEKRFELGRDVSCGAKTPLGRINTKDVYEAYKYLFGNKPPGTTSSKNPCPADRLTRFGGCCPETTYYDDANMRCADTSLINVPCPTNWVKNELGICNPIIRVPTTPTTPTTPGTQFTLPQLDLPGLYKPRSFGSISSMTIDHFVFDDAAVPSGHEAELDHLVALLNIYSEVQVHVEGNADSTGEAGYNVGLSKRRAEAVKKELVDRGIDAARIIITPHGESNLVAAPEKTEEDRARNRRVDIWYIVMPTESPFGLHLTPPNP